MLRRLFVLLAFVVMAISVSACARAPENVTRALALQEVRGGWVVWYDEGPNYAFTYYICGTDSRIHVVWVDGRSATSPEATIGESNPSALVVCGDDAQIIAKARELAPASSDVQQLLGQLKEYVR